MIADGIMNFQMIACRECDFFEFDSVGDGSGIGDCKHPSAPVDLPDGGNLELCHDTKHKLHSWRRPPMRQPLYPDIERRCSGFVQRETMT